MRKSNNGNIKKKEPHFWDSWLSAVMNLSIISLIMRINYRITNYFGTKFSFASVVVKYHPFVKNYSKLFSVAYLYVIFPLPIPLYTRINLINCFVNSLSSFGDT